MQSALQPFLLVLRSIGRDGPLVAQQRVARFFLFLGGLADGCDFADQLVLVWVFEGGGQAGVIAKDLTLRRHQLLLSLLGV